MASSPAQTLACMAPSPAPRRLSRVVFSGREARGIASFTAEPNRLLLLGFGSTKRTFTPGQLRDHRVIHVSTHATLVHNSLALVFSPINPDGSPRDGCLTSHELAATDLRNTELLLLSACHSSAGPVVLGEGIFSLARSALLAGAARVIATRWPVDDEAASRLFETCYALYWKRGLAPGAALRPAQFGLRCEPRFRSPCYWGAYYLVGKP
jgi:CHAT domain-containing protein